MKKYEYVIKEINQPSDKALRQFHYSHICMYFPLKLL
ncbi:hypothetical protein M2109_002532 [Paenibacillus sp. PastH-3]|nr:hypothetical protein [Paenibacillus sp. PastH-4]MDH6444314.1 hypothetical protein [Paenibacillus sp. PastF-4]MDH6528215.1 hypothetical protein [Paenibacillus sp. PastH-3]